MEAVDELEAEGDQERNAEQDEGQNRGSGRGFNVADQRHGAIGDTGQNDAEAGIAAEIREPGRTGMVGGMRMMRMDGGCLGHDAPLELWGCD